MKHFQYSVMGHGIWLRSLGWATKILGEVSFSPLAHTSRPVAYIYIYITVIVLQHKT